MSSSLFYRHNKSKPEDICVCRHQYLNHDSQTNFCVIPGCRCTNYVRLTKANAKTKVWGQENVQEPTSKDGGEMGG